jgi:8-oxo-dGTP diphosphatase
MPSYKYARPATAVDIIIFTIRDECLKILLVNRGIEPYKGDLALPGGFARIDETLIEAAKRELEEETHLSNFHIKMFGVFDEVDRDPRDRVISVGFYAIITSQNMNVVAGSDAEHADWYDFKKLPKLAFDHNKIVNSAFNSLTSDLENSSLAAKFLENEFTLAEFQDVYEMILTTKVDKRNFRKWINTTDFFIKTDNKKSGGQHRPAALYTVKDNGENFLIKEPIELSTQCTLNIEKNQYELGYKEGFNKALVNVSNMIDDQKKT